MTRVFLVLIGLSGAACGSKSTPVQLPAPNVSVQDHLAESERHNAQASAEHSAGQGESPDGGPVFTCADDPLESVSYIGGEAYKVMRPCWTERKNSWHQSEEKRHRKEAAKHRAMADLLVKAEGQACANLGEAEISQSPLTRGADILSVKPIYKGDQLQGAKVVLRKVPGLTVDWLERSLRCHAARSAALGYPTTFMTSCPMSLPSVTASVSEEGKGIVVTLHSGRDEIAAATLGRLESTLKSAGN